MKTSARARKLALTLHVTSSVGWLGAVVAFLALAVLGVTTEDDQTLRSAYIAMNVIGVAVLVPLSVASLASGLLQSTLSPWGLLRHYWVIVKLSLTLVASLVLLTYTRTLATFADAAASAGATDGVLPSTSPIVHAVGGLVILLATAALSVFKPRGVTRHGWRRQQAQRGQPVAAR